MVRFKLKYIFITVTKQVNQNSQNRRLKRQPKTA